MPPPFLIAVIVAGIIAAAASYRRQPAETTPHRHSFFGLLALVVIASFLATRVGPPAELAPTLTGLILGVAFATGARFLGGILPGLSLAVAASAAGHLVPLVPSAQLGMLLGAGLAAIVFSSDSSGRFALWSLLIVSADRLGASNNDAPGYAYLGTLLGVISIVGLAAGIPIPANYRGFSPVVAGLLIALGGVLLSRYVWEAALTVAVGLGATVGVVLHFLVEEGESNAGRMGLATILTIGLATVAFGAFRGSGMSLSLVAAAGVLAVSPNRRALLALGPLVGLVLYRVLREEGTGASRALDIGQHYTLLALALGTIVPLMFADWRGRGMGFGLWGLVGLTVPPFIITMFGVRGAVGFIVGLGFAAMVDALRRAESFTVYAAAAIMAPITLLSLHVAKDVDALTRDQKIPILIGASIVLTLLAGGLTVLGRGQKAEKPV